MATKRTKKTKASKPGYPNDADRAEMQQFFERIMGLMQDFRKEGVDTETFLYALIKTLADRTHVCTDGGDAGLPIVLQLYLEAYEQGKE